MSNDFDQDLYNQVLPPTRSQFNELAEKLDLLAIAIKSGLRSLLWAVLVIGTLILFFSDNSERSAACLTLCGPLLPYVVASLP